MRVKVFGFCFEHGKEPSPIQPSDIFSSLAAKSNLAEEDEPFRFGITTMPLTLNGAPQTDWWLGLLLKVRDSRKFTKVTKQGKKKIMSAQDLAGPDSLAEINVFLAHPDTGSGLFAHYHQSASFGADFCKIINTEIRSQKELAIERIQKDPALDRKQRKTELAKYRRPIALQYMLLEESFDQLVAKMKEVSKVRVRVSTLTTSKGLFTGHQWVPKSETVEMNIPVEALPSDVANDLKNALAGGDISKASAFGLDSAGNERNYTSNNNPYVLYEFDYDTAMTGFQIDMEDFQCPLQKSNIVAELVKAARDPNTLDMLCLKR